MLGAAAPPGCRHEHSSPLRAVQVFWIRLEPPAGGDSTSRQPTQAVAYTGIHLHQTQYYEQFRSFIVAGLTRCARCACPLSRGCTHTWRGINRKQGEATRSCGEATGAKAATGSVQQQQGSKKAQATGSAYCGSARAQEVLTPGVSGLVIRRALYYPRVPSAIAVHS